MPRMLRLDAPGRLYHLVSRGQDGKPIFRGKRDLRFFLALLALAARRGQIRIHAFTLLDNHFHLLVESLDGNISATMQWVLGRYAGYFNSVHGHTGHVFQGRYRTFRIRTLSYLLAVIRYIDLNPVKAGIVEDALNHRYGSAMLHAACTRRPLWLSRKVVDLFLEPATDGECDLEARYRQGFGLHNVFSRSALLVEARMQRQPDDRDDLDLLCRADEEAWAEWFARRGAAKAHSRAQLPVADAQSILDCVPSPKVIAAINPLAATTGKVEHARTVLAAGLLRDMGGLDLNEIAEALRMSSSGASRRVRAHREAVARDPAYVGVLTRAAKRALRRCLGPGARADGVWADGV